MSNETRPVISRILNLTHTDAATVLQLFGGWFYCNCLAIAETVLTTQKPLLTQTLQPLRDRFATEKDYLETNWSLVADWTSRRQVADWLAVSRWQVAISFKSAISRQPVSNKSNRRLVGDRLATTETSLRPKSVAARLLCMFKRQLATDSGWTYSAAGRRSIGDWLPTSAKPFCDLATCPRFQLFLVAKRSPSGYNVCVSRA